MQRQPYVAALCRYIMIIFDVCTYKETKNQQSLDDMDIFEWYGMVRTVGGRALLIFVKKKKYHLLQRLGSNLRTPLTVLNKIKMDHRITEYDVGSEWGRC